MAHTYMLFDLGSDEEKVQQARHKLENWKQTFRLDKKLQYKLEREQPEATSEAVAKAEPAKAEKPKPAKAKSKSKSASKSDEAENENSGPVKLFVRLYFSGHKNFPSSAGSTASPPKSRSRALLRKSSKKPSLNSPTFSSNSIPLSDVKSPP